LLREVESKAAACKRCPLFKFDTQTVFGDGPADAKVMLVGEQPGDQEDLLGLPFVGPAGKILNRALEASQILRDRLYLTNAVKHFKHVPRGKRPLHQKPNAHEFERCRWWLKLELDIIKPQLAVALGATAARGLMGRPMKIAASRGKEFMIRDGPPLIVTIHPSMLLRQPTDAARRKQFDQCTADLKRIAIKVPAVTIVMISDDEAQASPSDATESALDPAIVMRYHARPYSLRSSCLARARMFFCRRDSLLPARLM
jgi:uracil-DNA glycosylase